MSTSDVVSAVLMRDEVHSSPVPYHANTSISSQPNAPCVFTIVVLSRTKDRGLIAPCQSSSGYAAAGAPPLAKFASVRKAALPFFIKQKLTNDSALPLLSCASLPNPRACACVKMAASRRFNGSENGRSPNLCFSAKRNVVPFGSGVTTTAAPGAGGAGHATDTNAPKTHPLLATYD